MVINFCKGKGVFGELDGQYTDQFKILPLENVTYCASLMTNKPHLKKPKKPKDKNILKEDLDVKNRRSAIVDRG